ncbi:MAG TPA: hypothetical protein VFS14_00645 [Candidatus Saccharimonadales bacterium]|nr:hypothetical protein [Candidatus Saccharimonadales bacterium]
MNDDTDRQIDKKVLFVGTGVLIAIALLISWAYATSTDRSARNQAAIMAARSDGEKAYENIVKASLNVYHSRYSKYPPDYQALLDDIARSPDIYGVNDQGMGELRTIDNYLVNFSYSRIDAATYLFTYSEMNSGKTVTIKND